MSLNAQFNSTIGCGFVGSTLGTFLYGITCAQVMYYVRWYPMDHTKLKLLVALLWCVLDCHPSTTLSLFLGYWTQLELSQVFWSSHLWKVFRHVFVSTHALMSIGQGVRDTSFIAYGEIPTTPDYDYGISRFSLFKILMRLSQGAKFVDRGFHPAHRGSFSAITDHIITRLVLYTIQRGIVVTTLHARPFKLFWLVLYFSGSKLNVNSLLALLNIRDHLKSHKPTDYIGDNVLLGINQGGRAERHQNIYALQVLGDDHTSQMWSDRQRAEIYLNHTFK
ncbi:hypothetical protein IEO21_10028 [Rhodonia placenta]|uniref:DUF6534 domain-containing protein n=1 Tax=Rhodonia placenta TaxID=104341 RepID=A0A8H7TXP1_9APHY|nr:hypothetical protein IEO21_10028 [Postia placenta]